MSALTVTGLEAGYLSTPVLHGVDLSVEPGTILAVLGPNGAGKTTLLKSIVGLLPPRRGRVTFDGRDWTTEGPERRARHGVVLVPEGRRLFTSLTVTDNLRTGWLLKRGKTGPEDVYRLFPRLRERADVRAGSMSGGEQQMLAIGRAVLAEPSVLLIDEPSLGLAPITARTLFDTIRSLAGQGKAIILAEQNLRLSTAIADHAIIMRSGRVAYSAPCRTPEERAAVESAYREITQLHGDAS